MSRPHNTPSQTAGPFFSLGLTWDGAENLVSPEDPRAILVEELVLDGAGQPVPDALLEIWQADEEGQFPPDSRPNWPGFGRSLTDEEGAFHFFTIKPGRVTSADGTLAAPHIQVQVFGRGLLRQLSTRITSRTRQRPTLAIRPWAPSRTSGRGRPWWPGPPAPACASTSSSRVRAKRSSLVPEEIGSAAPEPGSGIPLGLFGSLDTTEELASATSDRAWLQAILDFEAALALAEAEAGLLPAPGW